MRQSLGNVIDPMELHQAGPVDVALVLEVGEEGDRLKRNTLTYTYTHMRDYQACIHARVYILYDSRGMTLTSSDSSSCAVSTQLISSTSPPPPPPHLPPHFFAPPPLLIHHSTNPLFILI